MLKYNLKSEGERGQGKSTGEFSSHGWGGSLQPWTNFLHFRGHSREHGNLMAATTRKPKQELKNSLSLASKVWSFKQKY